MKQRQSIWNKTAELGHHPRLTESIKKEAVVIGGGMAGILTAYLLQQKGVETVVLEADSIGSGQTGSTTAKITLQHGMIYHNLISRFGEKQAQEYAQHNRQAIEDYADIIAGKEIDCDFERVPAYLYTQNQLHFLEQEANAARRIGIDSQLQQSTKLPFPIAGALKFDNQAQFHPLKFLAAISKELEIYEKSPVLRVEDQRVFTPGGSAEGKILVFATHFPFINRPGYYFTRMHQKRSYVVSLENAEHMDGMYYGIDPNCNWSMRNEGSQLLFGGAGHRTGSIPSEDPYQKLQKKAQEFWPESKVTDCWSAQDCMTADQVPYIGIFSKNRPHWYVATGFNKWGMTGSMVSARLLTDQIFGSTEQSIFDPGRFKWTVSLPAMMKDSAISAKNLIASWAGAAPKCPHLGCHLHWNPFEKSWECQCHGSRFTEDGQIMDNPAQTNLPREEMQDE